MAKERELFDLNNELLGEITEKGRSESKNLSNLMENIRKEEEDLKRLKEIKGYEERLIQTKGFPVNFAYKYLIKRVDSLKDLLDFFSRFITKKSSITGVDLAKTIAHSRAVRRAKMNISDKFFGQKSLRVFILALIGEMNEGMTTIYQNADLNEIDHYFNYIEYDDTKMITEE